MYRGWNSNWLAGGALGFPWVGLIIGVIFIGLLVYAIFNARGQKSIDPKEGGIQILIDRFARGEIDAETFKTMKAELEA